MKIPKRASIIASTGSTRDWYYHTETQDKVYTEIASQFDVEKHAYLIVVDISSEFIEEENTCGVGGGPLLEKWNADKERRWICPHPSVR